MRLSILPVLLTGASVVSLVAAEPISVVELPSSANANIRLGHALANANVNGNDDSVARPIRPAIPIPPAQGKGKGFGRHFCGAELREKAIRLSNAFRHALGMPLIEHNLEAPRPGQIHVLHLGYPAHAAMDQSEGDSDEEDKPRKHHHHHHHHHGEHGEHDDHDDHGDHDDGDDHEHRPHHGHHKHHKHHHKHHGHGLQRTHCKSFVKRIHRAIKALGPWEGRAVAFVLGCGIGVLLRMFWVLSVLAYRTVRGERGEETIDREYIVYEHVPETVYMSPPQYADEKVQLEASEEEHK